MSTELVTAGFGDYDDPLHIAGVDIKPVDYLQSLIQRNLDRNRERIPDQEGYEIHFARGQGVSGGLPTRVTCTVYAEPDPP